MEMLPLDTSAVGCFADGAMKCIAWCCGVAWTGAFGWVWDLGMERGSLHPFPPVLYSVIVFA
jgi:hypothetical protein